MNKRLLRILLSVVLCISGFCDFTVIQAADKAIHIKNEEDFLEFAKNCKIDEYSKDLVFELDDDIALKNDTTYAIPIFMGTFHGNGHTVSNYHCANNGSNLGLFRYVEEKGVIDNLKVSGTISPTGSQCNIGGIVGTNYGTIQNCSFSGNVTGKLCVGGIAGTNKGLIKNCTSEGKITSKQYTGGICGYNEGEISDCTNSSSVNIEAQESGLDVEELSEKEINILDLNLGKTDEVTDTGGVCGGSVGIIRNSINSGEIGYQHYGYNVGGISGRQSGFIVNCENRGVVKGRKDVAGIVGQMEPHLYLLNSQNLVDELDKLTSSISSALDTLSADSSAMSGELANLKLNSSEARDAAQSYYDATKKLDALNSEEDSKSAGEVAQDIVNSGGNALEDAGKVDDSTIGDITSGNVTEDDITDISGVIKDSENTQAIKDKIAAKEQKAAEEAALKLQQEQALIQMQSAIESKMSNVGSSLSEMNDNISKMTADLANALRAVNEQFNVVSHLMAKLASGDNVYYEDISDQDTKEDTDGKVYLCKNTAVVEGDENVGGIAGEMALEVEMDQDGELTSKLSLKGLISKYFESRAVIKNCSNEGKVDGRKQCVGGIAGLTKVGIVFFNENYGDVSSEGKYIGGISGSSDTWINGCYAMCKVAGNEYVGGVVGEGTRISNSCANVTIADETTACNGAIAGYADVSIENAIRNNYFISESLGGVDGISYKGMAEPTEFEKLKDIEGLPSLFKNVTVTFVADDVIVKTVKVEYGKTLKVEDIPDVPKKKNYEGEWEDKSLEKITKNMTVSAKYTPLESSVESAYRRDGSTLSVILVEGDFDSVVKVKAEEYTKEIKDIKGDKLEALHINVSKKGDIGTYQIRYLAPNKDTDITLYSLSEDGTLTPLNTTEKGSYLAFETTEKDLTIVAVKETSRTGIFGVVAAVVVACAAFAVWMMKRKKKSNTEVSEDLDEDFDDTEIK